MRAFGYFFVFSFLVCLSGSLQGQNIVFPVIKNIKGNVRSVKEVHYKAVMLAGKLQRGPELTKSNYLLDNKNKLVEKNDYDSSGTLIERYVANYDDNENPVEETQFKNDSMLNKFTYRYDAKQNRVGWMSFTMVDTNIARGAYVYDGNGRIISDTLFDGKGRLVRWSANVFDKDGHLTKLSNYATRGDKVIDAFEFDMDGNKIQDTKTGFDGSTKNVTRFKYNDDAKLTAIDILSDSVEDYLPVEKFKYNDAGIKTEDIKFLGGKLRSKEEIGYDSAGNVNSDAYFGPDDKQVQKQVFKYDAHKNKLEEDIYMTDTLFEKWTYKYDAKMNKTEEDFFTGGNLSKLVVDYDKNGNPVKEVNYYNDQPIGITEREIIYY